MSIDTPAWLPKIAKEYGIFAAMVVFFTWWSYSREGQLNTRLDAQDEFIRKTLVVTVDNNTKAMEGFRTQLTKIAEENR